MARRGRKRKVEVKRYPNGTPYRHERVSPTPEMAARRAAAGLPASGGGELRDFVAHLYHKGRLGWDGDTEDERRRLAADRWQAAGQYRRMHRALFGRAEPKPGALADLLPGIVVTAPADFREAFADADRALRSRGRLTWLTVRQTVLFEQHPHPARIQHLVDGLAVLAQHFERRLDNSAKIGANCTKATSETAPQARRA